MQTVNIPNGHQAVMPYLMLDGAARFQNFVVKVFNAKILSQHYQPDSEKIIHSEVVINGSTVMFCDSTKDFPPHPANMFVYVANADATYKTALEEGALTVMEPSDQDYGRTCGVTDICGNVWWITSVT